MVTRFKKNLLFVVIIISQVIYSDDFLDQASDKVQISVDIVEREVDLPQNTEKKNQSLSKLSIHLEQEKLNQFLNDAAQKSQQALQDVLSSGFLTGSREQLLHLKDNDSFELKINKVGLGAACVGMATVLGFNRITKPGAIRSKLIFKRFLGFGSAYVMYKLVATNEIVKKDICDALAKIKID